MFSLYLSFKSLTQAYLVKASTTDKKNLTPSYLEDNDLISAKSSALVLSLNPAETFLPLKFLITSLCSSWVNSLYTFAPGPAFLK